MFAKLGLIPGGVGLAAAALLVLGLGLPVSPADAHCKGKHAFPHEHCTDGGPPADFDPELVWMEGGTIVIANGDGSNPTAIVDGGNPSWSPGGREILFNRAATNQGPAGVYRIPVFVGDPDEFNPRGQFSIGTPTLVAPVNFESLTSFNARWSPVPAPDGSYWIAYVAAVLTAGGSTGEAFLINPDTGDEIPLTDTENRVEIKLTWSHNATRIAVHTIKPNADQVDEDIVVYNLEAIEPGLPGLAVSGPVSLLLEQRDRGELLSGSNAAILASDDTNIFTLDWANTSDQIVVGTISPPYSHWIVPVPDVDRATLQQTVANDTVLAFDDDEVTRLWPRWSPDDTELLYRRSGTGGTCSIERNKKGKPKVPTNLVKGVLTASLDGTPEIKCEDETVLNQDGHRPEWWRGDVGFPPPLAP